jgi:THO complex subunit 2
MHGLPSRPEVPFPAHFTYDKFGTIKTMHPRDHKDHREGRDHRDPRDLRETRDPRDPGPRDIRDARDPRSLRLQDDSRPSRPRDYQAPPDRRVPEQSTRESHRVERDRPPPRPDSTRLVETGPQDRDLHQSRDRAPPGVSIPRNADPGRDTREIPSTVKPMPPPSQSESPGPTVNPERARLINADRPDDRSAVINQTRAARLNDGQYNREASRDRNSLRVVSPRRGDRSESHGGDPSRGDRRAYRESHPPGRDQRIEPHETPTRSGRAIEQRTNGPVIRPHLEVRPLQLAVSLNKVGFICKTLNTVDLAQSHRLATWEIPLKGPEAVVVTRLAVPGTFRQYDPTLDTWEVKVTDQHPPKDIIPLLDLR